MNVRLILQRNRKNVWTAELRQMEATLGRARGCTIRIPSSEVSRQHCRLRMENGILTVEDMESINGTFVNGRRVRDIQSLHPGDRLTLGSVTFLVDYAAATDPFVNLAEPEEHYPMVEAISEDEVVEEAPTERGQNAIPLIEPDEEPQPERRPNAIPMIEPDEEPRPQPKAQRATQLADTGEELSILDDPSSEIHLSGSSDDLRDFLIELDDSSEQPNLG